MAGGQESVSGFAPGAFMCYRAICGPGRPALVQVSTGLRLSKLLYVMGGMHHQVMGRAVMGNA